MSQVIRFGVAMESNLLEKFNHLITKKGYKNRSEAIRDLVRSNLVEEEWKIGNKETVGTITIVYSHHFHELTD
jgi:CopG family nickel-responsive transcriptional regulator